MRIRATFPFPCWVTGPTAESLSPTFRFSSRNCVVSGSFVGEEPLALPEPGDKDPWFRKVHSLSVEIDEAGTDLVTRVVAADGPEAIVGSLLKSANRIIRSLRNFGLVTHVREFRSEEVASDLGLDLLSVETSPDGTTWTRLRQPPEDLGAFLAGRTLLRREHLGEFKIKDLDEVQEAIEDDLAGGPERTFLANALEHLRRGDLRVAVVESVICLEILLGQLLPRLLEAASVPGDVLTKEITLFYRVKMLLPLLLPSEAASADLPVVLKTISWRNKIAHQSGYLPDGVPEKKIREGITSVVLLSQKLAHKRDSLEKAPTLKRLGQEIAAKFSVREPTIEWALRHLYTVKCPFFLDEAPGADRLSEISDAVVDGLTHIDPRCRPENDVFIYFSKFGTEIATWQGGRFHVINATPRDPFGGANV